MVGFNAKYSFQVTVFLHFILTKNGELSSELAKLTLLLMRLVTDSILIRTRVLKMLHLRINGLEPQIAFI